MLITAQVKDYHDYSIFLDTKKVNNLSTILVTR